MEKSLEYKVTAYYCFTDLQRPFDRVELHDVIDLLYKRNIPSYLIKRIGNICGRNHIQAKINNKLAETTIPGERGIH